MNISSALRQAIASAADATEERGTSADLLVRQFGTINARLLVRDHRGAVSKLRKAHYTLTTAMKLWDGSPKSAVRLARSAHSYHEHMRELSRLCSAPPVQPFMQKATTQRRKERAAYHRGRRDAPAAEPPTAKVT